MGYKVTVEDCAFLTSSFIDHPADRFLFTSVHENPLTILRNINK